MAKLSVSHITMIANDLPKMFGWHVLFLGINETKFTLLSIPLRLQLLPLARLLG